MAAIQGVPLRGTVEVGFVDLSDALGRLRRTPGRGAGLAVLAVQTGEQGKAVAIRVKRVAGRSTGTTIQFVAASVEVGSRVYTSRRTLVDPLRGRGYKAFFVPGGPAGGTHEGTPPGVVEVGEALRGWLLGTHGGAVTAAGLDAYLAEFVFRYEGGRARDAKVAFEDLVRLAMTCPPASGGRLAEALRGKRA
jgi:hypothetical protein